MATPHLLRPRLCLLPAQVSFNVVHHLRRPAESLLRRRARTEEDALGLVAGERDGFQFGRWLPQHGFLRFAWITHPEALPARGSLRLGQRLLAAKAKSHH